MIDEEKLRKVFSESLSIDIGIVVDSLEYNTLSEWDSVGHMGLVAAIENEFNIMLETDDIINMSSFKMAKKILENYS